MRPALAVVAAAALGGCAASGPSGFSRRSSERELPGVLPAQVALVVGREFPTSAGFRPTGWTYELHGGRPWVAGLHGSTPEDPGSLRRRVRRRAWVAVEGDRVRLRVELQAASGRAGWWNRGPPASGGAPWRALEDDLALEERLLSSLAGEADVAP